MSQPQLGKRLKAVRKAKNYTIEQVARLSGLSKSFISMLENGHTNISATRLETLASLFGLTASDLLAGDQQHTLIHLVRSGRGPKIKGLDAQVQAQLLTRDLHRSIQPVLLTLERGARHENSLGHPGEEFIYILSGHVELKVDGNQIVNLYTGDSAYYPSSLSHSYRNCGSEPALLITISTPPKPI